MALLRDTVILFLLGSLGWGLFTLIKFPVPALLGTIFFIGGLRAANIAVPLPPEFIYPLVQLMFGLQIGSGLTREATKKFKEMLIPLLIVTTWALTILFLLGYIAEKVTFLDLKTAILSSSVGGLPEMTVLALATNADVSIVVIAQTLRMIGTFIGLPLIIHFMVAKEGGKNKSGKNKNSRKNNRETLAWFKTLFIDKAQKVYVNLLSIIRKAGHPIQLFSLCCNKGFLKTCKIIFLSITIALVGGSLFYYIGVPAGLMVGSTFFIALASINGLEVITVPKGFIGVIQIGLGLEVSKNISKETFEVLASGELLITLLLLTLITIITSFVIALIVHKISKWDLATCLMACAPAGFTVMVALAIDYGKNSIQVTMLHMVRVLAIKICVPIFFMLLF
ncbi:MAG: AbrB family transcriptional regulator [Dethiobacteria bacterium]|jgi:membrane AbrB-like protein